MIDADSDETALPAGTVIDGRYRLLGRLGRGGFAWVYEGEHIVLERSAAIKVLSLPDGVRNAGEFTERFLREARIIAGLSHPNVVAVYDFGLEADSGQPYIAMELLQGHDLEAELLNHGPLEPQRARALFIGALDALQVAHEAGVVHKDLKPSNLFIADPGTTDERLVLLDFGIAWARSETRLTKVGAFTGTPAYAAPEYAKSLTVSPAVDVYQMGLILSEALTGVVSVKGDSPLEIIIAHCEGDIIIPAVLDTTYFGPIIRRATSFEAMARYPNGGAFRDALEGGLLSDRTQPMPAGGGVFDAQTTEYRSLAQRSADRALSEGPTAPLPHLPAADNSRTVQIVTGSHRYPFLLGLVALAIATILIALAWAD